ASASPPRRSSRRTSRSGAPGDLRSARLAGLEEKSSMIVGIPREIFPGERRVALVPAAVPALVKAGCEVVVEAGAGSGVGYADTAYTEKGARIASARAEVFKAGDVVVQVLCHGANDRNRQHDLPLLRRDQALIGLLRPLASPLPVRAVAATGARAFAFELMPRITRAQSMDALSSMSTVPCYQPVGLPPVR